MRGKKKRTYHYRPTTLTLSKLIELIDSGQEVIDLTEYSNGENWFQSLSAVLPSMLADVEYPSPGAQEDRV